MAATAVAEAGATATAAAETQHVLSRPYAFLFSVLFYYN